MGILTPHKIRFYKYFILLVSSSLLSSCIEVFDPDIDDSSGILVVDGLITDQPGPYEVRLSRSAPFDSFELDSGPETGAMVTITDGNGNEAVLTESTNEPGLYRTNVGDIQGLVGQSYSVSIETVDGRQYISEPETMLEAPPIEQVYFDFDEVLEVTLLEDGNFRAITKKGIRVFVDVKASGDQATKLRWDWEETFEVREFDIRSDIFSEESLSIIVTQIVPTDPYPDYLPKVDTCYITESPSSFSLNIASINKKNRELKRHSIDFVSREQKLGIRYGMLIKQFSLTDRAHTYWHLVKQQNEAAGVLFDPTPAQIEGNLKRRDGIDEAVLGYFGASAVTQKRFLVKKEELVPELDVFDKCNEKIRVSAEITSKIGAINVECVAQSLHLDDIVPCILSKVRLLMINEALDEYCGDCTLVEGEENIMQEPADF